MTLSRSFPLAVLTLAATFAVVFLGTPAVASAAAVKTAAVRTTAVPGRYHSAGATPGAVSPSGCVQRADYPHKSVHKPGTMAGAVSTKCTRPVPHMVYSAQMWETRWWGWDRIGEKGEVNEYNRQTWSVSASDVCKNNTVRTTGSGYVVDVDGRTYYASTESIHVTNPCHL